MQKSFLKTRKTRLVFAVLFISVATICNGQTELGKGYNTSENSSYWGNRKPYEGYWQQDIDCKIDAVLDDSTDIVSGQEVLTYRNNSPHALTELYFHLYQNAFTDGSYLHSLEAANQVKTKFGKYEADGFGTTIENLSIGRSTYKIANLSDPTLREPNTAYLDNTILKVPLDVPLQPGQVLQISIAFKSYFDSGSMRRRMKLFKNYGFKHFDCVHWYPRICVYDRKFGWETDQHLGKEFYGDFGAFDVKLTLPSHYVLEATGTLQNETEVLPTEYRQKIDIRNFATLPKPYIPNACNPADGKTKTWHFTAWNVHDFAWTADPLYRIGNAEWDGVKIVSLAEEFNAPNWQDAAVFTAKVIQVYSTDFGHYRYPKMVVADARDGMEYPMLTLDGGGYPGYHFVLAHEVGHNWFFGMVGNNETYRAALDEGFTQFLTTWSLKKIDGQYPLGTTVNGKPFDKKVEMNNIDLNSLYQGYLMDAVTGNDVQLNTHSDQFASALGHGGGYRLVYYKTATMLSNLQYVLGDDLFIKSMQHYFEQWHFAHPYFEDFRNSIINYSHVDLNWFFDQWMETTKANDYEVERVKKAGKQDGKQIYNISFNRKGRMQMPIDFKVHLSNGTTKDYHIPNTYFIKKTTATVLPIWRGWDLLNQTYTATIYVDGEIDNVVIDPSHRMADINYLDNSSKMPVYIKFDWPVRQPNNFYQYRMRWRPDAWYNGIDGVKAGLNLSGNYLNLKHKFELTAWYNTGLLTRQTANHAMMNYAFTYEHLVAHGLQFKLDSRFLDGWLVFKTGFEKTLERGSKFSIYYKAINTDFYSANYRLGFDASTVGQKNYLNQLRTLAANYAGGYSYNWGKGNLQYSLTARSNFLMSPGQNSYIEAKVINNNRMHKFELRSRFIARYGATQNPILSLYAAGASPEEMYDNKFVRSYGLLPNGWGDYGTVTGHFQHGGGLNLRGFNGYLMPEQRTLNGQTIIVPTYQTNIGTSISAELDFDEYINIKPKAFRNWLHFDTYLFADAGLMNQSTYNKLVINTFYPRIDAGLGICATIKKWGRYNDIQPLTIRFDMPLFLNTPPFDDPSYFKFRWLVGVNRSF